MLTAKPPTPRRAWTNLIFVFRQRFADSLLYIHLMFHEYALSTAPLLLFILDFPTSCGPFDFEFSKIFDDACPA